MIVRAILAMDSSTITDVNGAGLTALDLATKVKGLEVLICCLEVLIGCLLDLQRSTWPPR